MIWSYFPLIFKCFTKSQAYKEKYLYTGLSSFSKVFSVAKIYTSLSFYSKWCKLKQLPLIYMKKLFLTFPNPLVFLLSVKGQDLSSVVANVLKVWNKTVCLVASYIFLSKIILKTFWKLVAILSKLVKKCFPYKIRIIPSWWGRCFWRFYD